MRVHFIGSKGVSMARLMELTADLGHEVSGSDRAMGGHSARNIEGADMVVYTCAVGEDNIELKEAKRRGVPTVERAEYLGVLSEGYGRVIAVAGSHGKTTTTAMLAECMKSVRPTLHIGAKYSYPEGEGEYFITEACEYRENFLYLKPNIALVLNAELDHTDYYKSEEQLYEAFEKLSKKATLTVYNGDEGVLRERIRGRSVTFGFNENNDIRAVNLIRNESGAYSFSLVAYGVSLGDITLSVAGKHNAYNALGAIAVALYEGISVGEIRDGLLNFRGVERRMQFLGLKNGAEVYTDYAHHPTEINALISAFKSIKRKLIIVFEPHTYSRTRDLFDGFVSALSKADEVIIAPVFGARESEGRVNSISLYESASAITKCDYFPSYSQIARYLSSTLKSGDRVVFTGAGTIVEAAKLLLSV